MRKFHKIRCLAVIVLSLSPLGFSQSEASTTDVNTGTINCAPPNYSCARSDLNTTNNLNPPPAVSKQNTIVTPSDFDLPIVRVTDANTYGNKTLSVTLSGSDEDNIFNTNDTFLMVTDTGNWRYPISFDPSTMQVRNKGAWTPGTNQFRWGGSGSFSRTDPNTIYAVAVKTSIASLNPSGTALYKFKLSGTTSISATATRVFDFDTCQGMPNPYDVGHGVWRSTLTVSAGDKRFAQAFSNQKGGQNTGTDIAVYDAASGQCYRYDTAHAKLCTSSGCVPMSLSDEFTIHEVYLSLDGNYLRIEFYTCTKGGCNEGNSHPYFWEIGTTNVTRCYSGTGSMNCSGHMVDGYSHFYNSTSWPQTAKRPMNDLSNYKVVNLTPSDLTPNTDTHYSNNAADLNDTHPYWVTNVQDAHTTFGGKGCNRSGNVYEGCTFPGPLYGEIFGITQDGGYIRAAHSYNSGASSYFNCSNTIGAVSQTGKFFAWSSDWLTTLGKDSTGHYRCDVFIVNLAAPQGAKN